MYFSKILRGWVLFAVVGMLFPAVSQAAVYQVGEYSAQWETVNADRHQAESADFRFQYGDDESVNYSLPWSFTFYGQRYSQIVVDTNGNLWFNPTDPSNLPVNHDLAAGGNGPVISVWNGDHGSYFHSGVFIEHKTNPERVVVQWTTESWAGQGDSGPNRFQAVLYADNTVQFNYQQVGDSTAGDSGSGVSNGDGMRFLNLTQSRGAVPTLGQTTIAYLHDHDEDGIPDVDDPDDDNDGFSDEDEIAAGSDPLDDTSTPVSAEPVPAAGPLALGFAALLLVLASSYLRRKQMN